MIIDLKRQYELSGKKDYAICHVFSPIDYIKPIGNNTGGDANMQDCSDQKLMAGKNRQGSYGSG